MDLMYIYYHKYLVLLLGTHFNANNTLLNSQLTLQLASTLI